MSYSIEIFNAIESALSAGHINCTAVEEDGVIHFVMDGGRPKMTYKVLIAVRESNFSIHAILPITANVENEESLQSVAEFVCRANYGLILGHFNLDAKDGEIHYQTTIDCTDLSEPSEKMCTRALLVTLDMCSRYGPGFVDVIFRGESAQTACERCEKGV